MARYLSWIANAALLVLCCFLVASSANAVFASLLTPPPPALAQRSAADGPEPRTWADRQAILDRNLFKAELLAGKAPPPPPVSEDLEATKLPLDLLGTAASPNPELAWAAVQDKDARKVLVLRVDDEVRRQAKVMRIERKRIVLSENGTLRELVLDDGSPQIAAPKRRGRGGTKRVARRPARPPRPTPRPAVNPAANVSNAAEILSQARILPKYENGQMVGVEVNAIEAGSLFEDAGLEDGDLITEVNGIRVDSPEQSAQLLMEFVESKELTITVEGDSGTETLNVTLPD